MGQKPTKPTQHRRPSYLPETLIHIAGMSGSGKTTLGREIQKQYPYVNVLDTDIPLDEWYESVRNKRWFREARQKNSMGKIYKSKDDYIKEYLKKYYTTHAGPVVITGIAFDVPHATHKIVLKVPFEKRLGQLWSRSQKSLCSQEKKFKSMLKNEPWYLWSNNLFHRFEQRHNYNQ